MKKILYFVIIFFLGYKAHTYELFPLNRFFLSFIDDNQFSQNEYVPAINVYNKIDNKTEVNCPQSKDSIVIVAFGQSNSANHAGQKYITDTNNILNFYKGKCYFAADPLLGSTGSIGNIWIPTSLKIENDEKKIVLITFGVGGTKVSDWLGYLKKFYYENANSFKEIYPSPDFLIWFQGESDYDTNPSKFKEELETWIGILKNDFPKSNMIITGTTFCSGNSSMEIKNIQLSTSKKFKTSFIDTDKFQLTTDRYDDCHFSHYGIERVSKVFADTINSHL